MLPPLRHCPMLALNRPSLQQTRISVLVHSTVSELVEAGRDVVVVMHSYGGIPAE
jgi:hypothetical protein